MDFWSNGIAAVAGGVIGATGVILSQLLSQRSALQRDRELAKERRQHELRRAIQEYVQATQHAEYVASLEDRERKGAAHVTMWFAHKSLGLVADRELMKLADSYSDSLNDCLWSPSDEPAWQVVHSHSKAFMDAAHVRVTLS